MNIISYSKRIYSGFRLNVNVLMNELLEFEQQILLSKVELIVKMKC